MLITEGPEKGTGGLVEKRENAYINARHGIADKALVKMAGYICSSGSGKNGTAGDAMLKKTFQYRKYGYIAEEYYNRDASVVLVLPFPQEGIKR